MLEFLVSQGHRESELLDYSLDKLELYAARAWERLSRDEARIALRVLRVTRAAVASILDKEGRRHANQLDAILSRQSGEEDAKKEPGRARNEALGRIAGIVARRKLDQGG